jgi:flagellar basal-body rod modification protein FlgD
MSISSTAATSATTAATGASSTSGTSPAINENQFLQLLMAELKNQNPMSPNSSDPMSFITQLAQFTSLEQQTNTAQSTSQMASQQGTASAVALIGHTVTYTDSSGNIGTGLVQSVDITSAGPTLTINGTSGIDPSGVTQVS